MCLLWVKRSDAPCVPADYLRCATTTNSDGFGYAFAQDGALHVERFGPQDKAAFLAAYAEAEAVPGRTIIGHARFATSGPTTAAFAHPYLYTQDDGVEVAVAHNGVITSLVHDRATESDTSAFVTRVLAQLPAYWWRTAAQRYLVEAVLGSDKMTLLTSEGELVVLNESLFAVRDGVAYSNTYSLTPLPVNPKYTQWTSALHVADPKGKAPGKVVTPHLSARERRRLRKAERKAALLLPATLSAVPGNVLAFDRGPARPTTGAWGSYRTLTDERLAEDDDEPYVSASDAAYVTATGDVIPMPF